MKYKIVVGGRGSECYVHSIDENQKLKLSECGIDGSYGEHEIITEILDKNDIFDTDNIFLGPYNYPENYIIEVFNENNVKVWSSDTNHEFKDDEYEFITGEGNYLIVDDYTKGEFFNYEIDLEEDFDSDKLKPVITEVIDGLELITKIQYAETDLEVFKEYGDYWSKGITYHLSWEN
jgi:hypothetical protein